MRKIRTILVFSATTLMALALYGQSHSALKGLVLDISGAVIPDARVGIFSMDQAEETTSDRYGKFIFTNLAQAIQGSSLQLLKMYRSLQQKRSRSRSLCRPSVLRPSSVANNPQPLTKYPDEKRK
jgi:hypothetical protein